jgi:hypothetical protein
MPFDNISGDFGTENAGVESIVDWDFVLGDTRLGTPSIPDMTRN